MFGNLTGCISASRASCLFVSPRTLCCGAVRSPGLYISCAHATNLHLIGNVAHTESPCKIMIPIVCPAGHAPAPSDPCAGASKCKWPLSAGKRRGAHGLSFIAGHLVKMCPFSSPPCSPLCFCLSLFASVRCWGSVGHVNVSCDANSWTHQRGKVCGPHSPRSPSVHVTIRPVDNDNTKHLALMRSPLTTLWQPLTIWCGAPSHWHYYKRPHCYIFFTYFNIYG